MKKLLCTLLASVLSSAAGSQELLPVRDSIGKLTLSVDPRMELLGAVQLIAGYPLCTRDTPYSERAQNYFSAFAQSEAAKCTKMLLEKHGFSYDAPPGLMLYCSFPPELSRQQPYSDYLGKRAGGEENLRHYRTALQRFAEESRFAGFWTENEAFYRQAIAWCKRQTGGVDVVRLLESYFNMEQESYDIILCPLFGHNNYGPRIAGSEGRSKLYALVNVPQDKRGELPANWGNPMGLVLHEFSHSFVNPAVDRHADLLTQSSDRYEPIREKMQAQAYGNWTTCVNEHLVRAAAIRMQETIRGREATEQAIRAEEQLHFGYIRPLIAKFREYEALRDSAGITFADYVPELLSVFSESELYEPRFQGPVNAVLSTRNVVYVYPTVGDDAAVTARYVHSIVDWINSRQQQNIRLRCVADSVAVKKPLDTCDIVCYGTVACNLLLAKYRSTLPFRVEQGAIVADRRYDDPGVRLIACMPNPENPELGMVVYTAVNEQRVADINNVFHGPDDFCIFIDRNHILSRGYLEKTDSVWCFPQPQP